MLNGKISIDDPNTNDSKTLLVVLLLVLVPALCLLLIAVLVALRRLGVIRGGGSNSTFTGLDPADSQSSPPAAEVDSGLLGRLSALASKFLLRRTAQATNESAAGPSSFEPLACTPIAASSPASAAVASSAPTPFNKPNDPTYTHARIEQPSKGFENPLAGQGTEF